MNYVLRNMDVMFVFIFFSKYTAALHHVFSYCCLIMFFHSCGISCLGLPMCCPIVGVFPVVGLFVDLLKSSLRYS